MTIAKEKDHRLLNSGYIKMLLQISNNKIPNNIL